MKNIACTFLCLIIVSACNSYNITDNKEPIFNNYKPDSKEYKNKLAEKIQSNPDELTYIFNRYIQKDGNDYLEIAVTGNDIYATGLVLVSEKRNGVEGIIDKKGMSYGGAHLVGLQLDILENPSGAQLIYKGIDYILD